MPADGGAALAAFMQSTEAVSDEDFPTPGTVTEAGGAPRHG
jgi:hypothetical protein